MSSISQLIEDLRKRNDLRVANETDSWRICITKGRDWTCEIVVPHDVLEWHASVKRQSAFAEVWSDWMDYSGYDDRPKEVLQVEMANDIRDFVNLVLAKEDLLPLRICK
jgi:hypothetical protein